MHSEEHVYIRELNDREFKTCILCHVLDSSPNKQPDDIHDKGTVDVILSFSLEHRILIKVQILILLLYMKWITQ